MKTNTNTIQLWPGKLQGLFAQQPRTFIVLALGVLGLGLASAADNVEADKLLAAARAKETHAQELRTSAAAASQKAADDELEASAEDRQARILSAQAMQLMKADANKQKAFQLRQEARQQWAEVLRKETEARNEDSKAAQHKHNAEELEKASGQLHDQAAVAATLGNDAKAQETLAQHETQLAESARTEATQLTQRAVGAWREAEKLDPETHQKVAPPQQRPAIAPKREVK